MYRVYYIKYFEILFVIVIQHDCGDYIGEIWNQYESEYGGYNLYIHKKILQVFERLS